MRGRCKSHSKIQVAHKGQKKRSGITWMLAWFCDHAEVMYLKNASFFLRACCGNATGQIFWSTAPSHLSCDIFRGYLTVRLLLRSSKRYKSASLIIITPQQDDRIGKSLPKIYKDTVRAYDAWALVSLERKFQKTSKSQVPCSNNSCKSEGRKHAPLAWASGSLLCFCCWERQGGCGKIGLLLEMLVQQLLKSSSVSRLHTSVSSRMERGIQLPVARLCDLQRHCPLHDKDWKPHVQLTMTFVGQSTLDSAIHHCRLSWTQIHDGIHWFPQWIVRIPSAPIWQWWKRLQRQPLPAPHTHQFATSWMNTS